jgi:putative aldouronate transport system permease protein
MKLSLEDKIMHVIIYSLLILMGFIMLYPYWNSLVISFNVGKDTMMGGLTFWPREFTLENYRIVFQDKRLVDALYISVMRTVIGTVISIFFTSMFAYGMTVKGLVGKKYYMIFCIITMYFGGGLIPYFLLIRELGMMNSFWVYVIPSIISVWNMIIFRAFFMGLPAGLEESAKIDGASLIGIFFRIILPISGPVIATLSLFTAVGHWNEWFSASIFISDAKLLPVQTVLQQILKSNIVSEQLMQVSGAAQEQMAKKIGVTAKSLTMATMVVATIPIILVYPFVQKYFVKGVLVGSLKE